MKRGQFWYTDYLIGLLVFMIIGVLFFRTFVDISSSNAIMEELVETGVTISNSLMGEGYLHDQWINSQGRIGFVDNAKLNITSYDLFKNLVSTGSSGEGYATSKYLIGTKYDYITYFEDVDGNPIQNNKLDILGKDGINSLDDISNANAIVKFVRFVWVDEYEQPWYPDENMGKGRILRMVVMVWQ